MKIVPCIFGPGKVGSWTLSYAFRRLPKSYHCHNLDELTGVLKQNNDFIILIGIREPTSRNLSYFFEIFDDRRTSRLGHCCYIGSQQEIRKMPIERIVDAFYFYQSRIHYYKQWYESAFKFLDISELDIAQFDKQKGYMLVKNVFIYRLEDLNKIKPIITDLLGADFSCDKNVGEQKWYSDIYQKVKQFIAKTDFKKNYIKDCYNWEWIKYFYDESDLFKFRRKFLSYS